ncbi:MAG: TrkH family potassium uptake protein [Dysgonamonadaceae bacterium]|jgi:trk system potassium uptake protein TrkH|nr:TrkH family potassium uptake protein [Dysgonamonadaceae bacterium]
MMFKNKTGFNIHWEFIVKIVGLILIFESLFIFLSAAVSAYFHESVTGSIVLSAVITFASGLGISLSTGFKKRTKMIGKKESYLGVALSWILFALFGALPFYISGVIPSFSDAFFEAASGITTTGATVLVDIESVPKGLLFWRSITQWLGGMGIIVFSIALLPLLGGEAAQLFDAEASGLTHDKFRPRVTQMAKRLLGVYLLFSFLIIVLLWCGPMGLYDAVCHGFSTISTGGFSTKQSSIAYWNSIYTEIVIILFMTIGAINFPLLYFLLKGRFKKISKDEELRWFLSIILVVSCIVSAGLIYNSDYNVPNSFRSSLFQVVSVISTTGFSTDDFSVWGPFYLILFLFLMIVCGCAGSTSGGLKIVRAVVLAKNTIYEFERLLHPRAVISVRLNGRSLSFGIVQRLLAFAFLYISIIFVSWGVLSLIGIPFVESLGAVVTSIGNVGPGFETNGPCGSFAGIPSIAKWYLSFLMIIGRLEIFTILILFTPGFWKK